jgi:hypothetical protein
LREASSAEQMMVHKARRALEEAEAKLKLLKYWNREFDSRAEPLVKQLQKLHTLLAHDMVKAGAFLTEAIHTLTAYAEIAPPSAVPVPGQTADQNPAVGATAPEGGDHPASLGRNT